MKKIVLAVMVVLAIWMVGSFFTSNQLFSFGSGNNLEEEKQVDSQRIRQIDATVDIGDIMIEKSPDDQIHVQLQGKGIQSQADELDFEVEENGDTLSVTLNRENNGFLSFLDFNFGESEQADLAIMLPEKEFDSIRLTSNIGDITVKDGLGAFEIESDVGKVSLDLKAITKDISVHSTVGDVDVTIDDEPDQLVLDLQCNVGEVKLENIDATDNSPGRNADIEIGQDGPALEVTTDVGDINVEVE